MNKEQVNTLAIPAPYKNNTVPPERYGIGGSKKTYLFSRFLLP